MKILCIIPAFNAENYIAAAIHALRNQSYKDIQIVVVDDLSSDNTFNIAKSLNVDVIKNNRNVGPYQALNIVLNSYSGFDAWYFHGADDVSYENLFSELSAPLINNPNLMMTWCNFKRIEYATNKLLGEYIGRRASMCLYRADVFNIIGPYDNTRFGGDTEYWDRFLIYFKPNQIKHVNLCLANCMVHNNNLTVIIPPERRRNYVNQFKTSHQLLKSSLTS